MNLNEKKAIGIENIPIRFLKMTSEITSSLLSNLFNKCILRGSFPNRLKIAKVTPLYKSGPTHKTTNYRPISILSSFSKIFEKIIYNRLNNYFSTHNVLAKEQFGFRTKHSTNHVISDVTNKLQNLRDNNYSTCLILLDLSKAFDTVNHKILLNKLEKYGIRGNSLTLIRSYLTNRKQTVHINNTYSLQQTLTCGVPQGSILGPLLFSIYINDLPKASKFETRLYADDTALMLSEVKINELNENVNRELVKVEHWLNANKLSLNYTKTKYLLIKPFKNKCVEPFDFDVKIKGVKIDRCYSIKYLGILLDEDLSWKPHISNLRKKLSQGVGIIAKMKNYLNKQNLIALYYTFFYSHILYGILGWGSISETEIKPIQILQNKVLRIINKSTWKDRVTINALHKSLNILKIADIYNFELSKFMYLYHTQSLPEIFDPYFLPIEQAHHYNTRSKSNQNYYLNSVRKNSGKKSIKFLGVKMWNQIPPTIKSYTFYRYKKECRQILINKYD